jgi:hypothetical protein
MKPIILLIVFLLPLTGLADYVVPADSVSTDVNLRRAASAESELVGRMAKGDRYPLVEAKDGWLEVELPDGGTGFVHADWARVSADSSPDSTPAVAAEPVSESEPDADTDLEPPADAAPAAEKQAEPDPAGSAEASPEPAPVTTPPAVTSAPAQPPSAIATGTDPLAIKGTDNFLVRIRNGNEGRDSQIFDDGNFVGIGTTAPKQRLEVNGSIQIHDQNSNLAGLMITQSGGDTGYILHNRASTMTIGAGSIDRITIDRDGNVGLGASELDHPLQMASGAHVTAGGVWTNNSTRAAKQDIAELTSAAAGAALDELQPVQFRYRNEPAETYLGFIAEDVPELVAMEDRQSLSAMDIVALLTRVVQDQQQRIAALEAQLAARQ